MTAAEQALELVRDGMTLGLGSGRAASEFVRALGTRVGQGLRIRGVPTSRATATLARQHGIALATLEEVEQLDLAIDGADEVDPQLRLIKGLGAALVREKIVASAARRLIILVGPEKLVDRLGARGVLPIEVIPFGLGLVRRHLCALGYPAAPRLFEGQPLVTDNGNHILDCAVSAIADPAGLEQTLRAIPGVVGTGLFLDPADTVLIGHAGRIEEWHRP